MSWIDAAHAIRGAWGFFKNRRRKPHFAEPEVRPTSSMDHIWRASVDSAAARLADRARKMHAARSPMADLVTRMAAEAYADGDMSWEEFRPYRETHEREKKAE